MTNPNKSVDNILDEVAISYSHGNIPTSLKKIKEALEENLDDKRVWFMCLDILDADPLKLETYVKLNEAFVQRFNVTAPPRKFLKNTKQTKNWSSSLVIQNSISTITKDKKKDFIRSLEQNKSTVSLDLSRAKLDESNEFMVSSLNSLYEIFSAISKSKRPLRLMGEVRFLEELENNIHMELDFLLSKKINQFQSRNHEQQIASEITNVESAWLIVLELHQWRGNEEEFNKWFDLFLDFWLTAPVGYEQDKIIAINTPDGDPYQDILSFEIITDREINLLIQDLNDQLLRNNKITINLSQTKRVFYDSCLKLSQWLAQKNVNSSMCTIIEPSTPVLYILKLTGVINFSHIKERKF